MIVYNKSKKDFLLDSGNYIADIVDTLFREKLNRSVQPSEFRAWENSLNYMYHVLNTNEIPDSSGVAIEYNIPRTNNRIDFIITGKDETHHENIVIIELKQWQKVQMTEKDAIVITRFEKGPSEIPHPSYQAWSYSVLLSSFNSTIYNENINLIPCAYLHNYVRDGLIDNPFYNDHIKKAPLFCKGEKNELQSFIKKFIKYGDGKDLLLRIENGEIRPSKNLCDNLLSMLRGNEEFIMIDTQKVVFENAILLAKQSLSSKKNVLLVHGGPGTGKSVIAVNLLVGITNLGLITQYVTKNAAPRAVYESKLKGSFRKTEISNFFTGSGSFIDTKSNIYDALIVDEAHRLNEFSGMMSNLGENQIQEIINAAKFSVFFLDEDQRVTLKDIGEEEEIIKWAKHFNAQIHTLKLTSQFRCNGSDGYLAWLDNTLQIHETANVLLKQTEFDFKIFDNPNDLRETIVIKNNEANKARLVAGYCWNWISKKKKDAFDVVIPEYDFKMQWNLTKDGSLWIVSPESIDEIGCIHTCQGLELDYIGVIVGNDLIVREEKVITDPSKRAKTDKSISGYKRLMADDELATKSKIDKIIKNTYRTLMTRGMKGCYVYFVDKETENYFKSRIR